MTADWPSHISRRAEIILVSGIILLALLLRIIAPWYAPRGWRDDELSSALVVTGHVLDGDFRLYYPDASGHEGLYEYFQAATLLIFGPGVWGIRGPSILFGTLAVLLVYLLARQLFDWPTAALTAVALAVSFWSLMYSRTGQRHISVTATTLLCLTLLWRAAQRASAGERAHGDFALAGMWMGVGFYTYFASRGLPLIVAAWGLYLLIWNRQLWTAIWKGLTLALLIAALLGLPLAITLWQQPEAETRVSEVARPLHDARQGDFSTLARYSLTTLSMFTHNGDEEWLYNVPHRPVFGIPGGILFWAGIVTALRGAFGPSHDPRMALLLLWIGAGITPGALSVPAASLGHTILAQPVAMILPALAITGAGRWLAEPSSSLVQPWWASHSASRLGLHAATILVGALIFLGWEGVRGIRDYFSVWPADPFNRVLHHSDLHEAASWLNAQPSNRNVAIGSFLVERWDQQVMKLDLQGEGWRVRAFDPRVAYIQIPGGGIAVLPEYLAGGWGTAYLGSSIPLDTPYAAHVVEPPDDSSSAAIAQFENGLALRTVEAAAEGSFLVVLTTWRVEVPLVLPPFPLMSKPPVPGEDGTPRLAAFVQLLDSSGRRVAGADGLGVDPYTLYPGDVFVQRFDVPFADVPAGSYVLIVGLYNPASGERHQDGLTGLDYVSAGAWQRP